MFHSWKNVGMNLTSMTGTCQEVCTWAISPNIAISVRTGVPKQKYYSKLPGEFFDKTF